MIKKMGFHHREIMRRLFAGQKQCVIASEMGMTEPAISRVVNDPLFQQGMALTEENMGRAIAEVQLDIAASAGEALDFLLATLRDPNASSSLKARIAIFILEASGCGRKSELKVEPEHFDIAELVVASYREATGESPEKFLPESSRHRLDV